MQCKLTFYVVTAWIVLKWNKRYWVWSVLLENRRGGWLKLKSDRHSRSYSVFPCGLSCSIPFSHPLLGANIKGKLSYQRVFKNHVDNKRIGQSKMVKKSKWVHKLKTCNLKRPPQPIKHIFWLLVIEACFSLCFTALLYLFFSSITCIVTTLQVVKKPLN